MIILDTNVLSEVMRKDPSLIVLSWLDAHSVEQIWVCAISRAEIFLGITLLPEGKRRDVLYDAALGMFNDDSYNPCLPVDALAADTYAEIVTRRRRLGRPISVEVAQIAAIACADGMTIATRNRSDFEDISGFETINPWLED
jgi:predicted nucleic acid-binding protein